jgi:F-type H+-transporting ATPase subunit epsilon
MKEFQLEIVTPDGVAYKGECEALITKSTGGEVEILAGHTDYLASLATGTTRIKCDGKMRYASSQGGFLTVKAGRVRMVCTTFEFSENIDVERARRSKEEAERLLATEKDDRALTALRAKLMRAVNRIRTWEMQK